MGDGDADDAQLRGITLAQLVEPVEFPFSIDEREHVSIVGSLVDKTRR